jgi:hypothetical protein
LRRATAQHTQKIKNAFPGGITCNLLKLSSINCTFKGFGVSAANSPKLKQQFLRGAFGKSK